jgi:ribose-phosphate pyrophosphokinase
LDVDDDQRISGPQTGIIHTVMHDLPRAMLFSLSEGQSLGGSIAREAGMSLAPLEERTFEEGEFKLRPLLSVRGQTAFVLQSLAGSAEAPVGQRLMRLLFLLFGLRDAGAARTIALVPYLAFARKDRRTQLRDPVSARYVAQLLEATGISHLIALDAHNPAAFDNAFRIPVDHLSAIPMFVDYFAGVCGSEPLAVASPDVGGVKRAQIFRERLEQRLDREVELAFIEKRRVSGVVSGGRVIGDVEGREVIVFDDLCATGGTLIGAASALCEAGARSVRTAFTHAPSQKGLAALSAAQVVAQVVFTDSVGGDWHVEFLSRHPKFHRLSIAPLFAQAMTRLSAGGSLAPLLEKWPPVDAG